MRRLRFCNVPRFIGAAIFGLLVCTISVQAEIYRWSDSSGLTHFGDTPPEGRPYERVELPQDEVSSDSPTTLNDLGPTRKIEISTRDARFASCVQAQYELVSRVRLKDTSDQSRGNWGASEEDEALGIQLTLPVTNLKRYWQTTGGQRTFSRIVREGPYDSFSRAIDDSCDLGTAIEERQLAALNARILEVNCRALREAFEAGSDRISERSKHLLRDKVRNECG